MSRRLLLGAGPSASSHKFLAFGARAVLRLLRVLGAMGVLVCVVLSGQHSAHGMCNPIIGWWLTLVTTDDSAGPTSERQARDDVADTAESPEFNESMMLMLDLDSARGEYLIALLEPHTLPQLRLLPPD